MGSAQRAVIVDREEKEPKALEAARAFATDLEPKLPTHHQAIERIVNDNTKLKPEAMPLMQPHDGEEKRLCVDIIRATGLRHPDIVGNAPWCVCEVSRLGADAGSSRCRTKAHP